jgi:hypothetical protein
MKGDVVSNHFGVAGSPDAAIVRKVLKRGYLLLAKDFVVRVGVFALLIVAAGALGRVWDSPLPGVLIYAAVLGFVLMAYRFPIALASLAKRRKVLCHYPLEFRPSIDIKTQKWTKFGAVFTLRIKDHEPGRSPLMEAVEGLGRQRRPEGVEDGVWVAGDLPFGGVVIVPSNGSYLLIRPAKWEKLASEREQAGPDRIARAQRAGLGRIH